MLLLFRLRYISLSVSEGTSNSPDIWNGVNGLNQQGYEGALGVATTHQTQPGSYNLQPTHTHMVRFTARRLHIAATALLSPPPAPPEGLNTCLFTAQDYSPHPAMAADISRGLPPMSTFHRNSALDPSENSTGESSVFRRTFSPTRLTEDSIFQSRGATETPLRGPRRATLWAKRWLL